MKDEERLPHHHGHTRCREGASDHPLQRLPHMVVACPGWRRMQLVAGLWRAPLLRGRPGHHTNSARQRFDFVSHTFDEGMPFLQQLLSEHCVGCSGMLPVASVLIGTSTHRRIS